MRLRSLLEEVARPSWAIPSAADEWEEISENEDLQQRKRWLSLFPTRQKFADAVVAGRRLALKPGEKLGNRDYDLSEVDPGKLARVRKLFAASKTVDMPIVVDGKPRTLLSGNTRLNYAESLKLPINVWLITP